MEQEAKIRLKGPHALVALLVLLAVGGVQWVRLGTHFPTGGPKPAIEEWIANAYRTGSLEQALDEASKSLDSGAAERVMAAAAERGALNRIEITDLSARASGRDEYVVRVHFLIDGNPPPDGKGERFLRVEKRSAGGWFVRHETSKFTYYTTVF